jgi:aldehyde dehydrogenase (NAD+)
MTIHSMIAKHPFLDGVPKRLLIGGQWIEAAGGTTFDSINPSDGSVIARIADGGAKDIDSAVEAARRAFEGPWRRSRPYERQLLLLKLADLVEARFEELAALDTLDMGIPVSRVKDNKARAVGMIRYYASHAVMIHGDTLQNSVPGNHFSYTVKEPVGVVGAIIAWNSPLTASIMKICPTIAAGCTVVLKPSEEASLTPLRLGELCLEAGFPEGVLNIVTGRGAVAGAALTSHPGVSKIAFTGSVETGQRIVAASAGNIKRLSLELGGKSPHIIFADADLETAAPVAAMGVFGIAGQSCQAGTRLFVQRKVYDDFTRLVADVGRKLVVGDSRDPATEMGPLVSARQLKRVSGYLDSAFSEGARAVTGGRQLSEGALAKGYFVAPTVFADVRDDMRIAKEEIFGPVISALPFDDEDEVIRRANAATFGLGGGVWTRDIGRAHRVANSLQSGMVWINSYNTLDPAVPHGGVKMSGYGREMGPTHVDEFLSLKTVWIRTE